MTTGLEVEPTIAKAVQPRREVLEIMTQAMFNEGCLGSYLSLQFGSAWYVEVPRHLNQLYEELGEGPVRDVVYKLLDQENDWELLWDAVEGKLDLPNS